MGGDVQRKEEKRQYNHGQYSKLFVNPPNQLATYLAVREQDYGKSLKTEVWHVSVWTSCMMETEQCISGLEKLTLCLTWRATYWPCRPGGIWEHTPPHLLAHVLHFRGKLKLAPRSLIDALWWCSQSKPQCRRSCVWLSLNFCLTDRSCSVTPATRADQVLRYK